MQDFIKKNVNKVVIITCLLVVVLIAVFTATFFMNKSNISDLESQVLRYKEQINVLNQEISAQKNVENTYKQREAQLVPKIDQSLVTRLNEISIEELQATKPVYEKMTAKDMDVVYLIDCIIYKKQISERYLTLANTKSQLEEAEKKLERLYR